MSYASRGLPGWFFYSVLAEYHLDEVKQHIRVLEPKILIMQEIRQVVIHIQDVKGLIFVRKLSPKMRLLPSPDERSIPFQAGQQSTIRHIIYVLEPFNPYRRFPGPEAWKVFKEVSKIG